MAKNATQNHEKYENKNFSIKFRSKFFYVCLAYASNMKRQGRSKKFFERGGVEIFLHGMKIFKGFFGFFTQKILENSGSDPKNPPWLRPYEKIKKVFHNKI